MITVDLLMVGFKFFLARLEGIAVSRDKKITKEQEAIYKKQLAIDMHIEEIRRAKAASAKMKEFIV